MKTRTVRKAGSILVAGASVMSLFTWADRAGAIERSPSLLETAATGANASVSAADAEIEFLVAINGARAMIGSPPLMPHPEIQASARAHAQAMASQQRLFHSDLGVLMGVWWRAGENVGVGGSVKAVHDALIASPDHWINLMNAAYTYAGIGVALDANGILWTSHVFVG